MQRRAKTLGIAMIIVGGLWAFAVMIWLPPMTLFILNYFPQYDFKPDIALEAVLSVALIVLGIFVRRRSKRRCRPSLGT